MSNPNLHKAAIWYARHGWYVLPLHEPLFDTDGNCTGCSCERWKRENMPGHQDYICPTPGKHPRHNAWEDVATTDTDQISRWWRAWPSANIGIAAGKSGIVCLDADTYKDGGGQWEREWGETVTSLTGGGGEHLIYKHPDCEPLGNSSKGLPAFIDVRGHGGQFVVAPSVHPSGNRYEWETGYGPHEMETAVLPEPITAVLLTATKSETVRFSESGNGRIDIDWQQYGENLPALVLALLRDDRSKIDFWVVRSLVKAGMSPDEIKAVWDTYDPSGKYSDKGRSAEDYLARTIASAESHLKSKQLKIKPERTAA